MTHLVAEYVGNDPLLKGERYDLEDFVVEYGENSLAHGTLADWRIVDDDTCPGGSEKEAGKCDS